MACTLFSTSSAACSSTKEFVKDTSEASTDCRRPNAFANNGESPSETSVTKPLMTSPIEECRLYSTSELDVARDASTVLRRSTCCLAPLPRSKHALETLYGFCHRVLDGLRPGKHTEEPLRLVASHVRNKRPLEVLNRSPSSPAIPKNESDNAANNASLKSNPSYKPASNTGIL